MVPSITDIARVASIPSWMRSKPWAGIFNNPSIMLLWIVIPCWHCIWTMWQMLVSKLNLLPLLLLYRTRFVITLFHTLMMEMYLWTLCNMWHVCWIIYDLGCLWIVYRDPSWYSTYYRVYMGSSMIVRPLVGCHCTCALINWSVLLQVPCAYDLGPSPMRRASGAFSLPTPRLGETRRTFIFKHVILHFN